MSKRLQIEKYGLDSYDDHLCLRPSKLLVACTLFLSRGVLLLAVFGLIKGVPDAVRPFVDADRLWEAAIAALPAVGVLYALAARLPGAPTAVRWIWRNGRALLALSAVSYVALAAVRLGSDPQRWLASPLATKALVIAEVAILVFVVLSARVRDTFLEFPAA